MVAYSVKIKSKMLSNKFIGKVKSMTLLNVFCIIVSARVIFTKTESFYVFHDNVRVDYYVAY
jgi:hypothetical protein